MAGDKSQSSDRMALIIPTALAIFGGYFSVAVYCLNLDIIYISSDSEKDFDQYTIKNISITRTLQSQVFRIRCVATKDCLEEKKGDVGKIAQVAPFAAAGTQSCNEDSDLYEAAVSVAPGGVVRLFVNKKEGTKTTIFLEGKAQQAACTNIEPVVVHIETSHSFLVFLLENFWIYIVPGYFGSLILLIVVFIWALWKGFGGRTRAKL